MNEKVEKRNFVWSVGIGQEYHNSWSPVIAKVASIIVEAPTATSAAHKAKLEASCQGIVDPKIISVDCEGMLEVNTIRCPAILQSESGRRCVTN